jgi:hypothetical protein
MSLTPYQTSNWKINFGGQPFCSIHLTHTKQQEDCLSFAVIYNWDHFFLYRTKSSPARDTENFGERNVNFINY